MTRIQIILILGAALGYLIVLKDEVRRDAASIFLYGNVKHKMVWKRRAVRLSPVGVALFIAPLLGYPFRIPFALITAGMVAGLLLFSWWLLFSGFLARSLNRPFFWAGSNDAAETDKAWSDVLVAWMPTWGRALTKISLFGLFIYLYVQTFLKPS